MEKTDANPRKNFSHVGISSMVTQSSEDPFPDLQEQLIFVLNAANLGTWSFDLETGIAIHSLRHDQIFGYDELQAEWSYEISIKHMLPEFHRIARDSVSNAIKTGNLSFEAKVLWTDGSIHWIAPTGRVLYDDTGKPIRISGVVADITERKQSEESLRASERRYSALFSNKINGMARCEVIYDETGKPVNYRILEINEAYERIIGVKKADIEGRLATEAFPDIKNYKIDYIGMYGNLALRRSEIKFEEFFEASQQYLSIYAYSPEPGEFIAIFTDVSDRINAEKKLLAAQERLNLALESANIGLWEQNIETNELIWDEKLEDMFGLKPGTFGKTFEAFEDLVNEEDLPHVRKAISLSLEKELLFETIYRTKPVKGEIKYISSKAIIKKNDKGKPVSLVGVSSDVTDLKKDTDQQILRLNEELLRSNNELENFAYVASHDLQEPLRMVTSFTQLLSIKYGDKLDDTAKEYINFAVEGSKRMYELLNGLLAYSRIKTKGQKFTLVDLNDIIDTVKANLRLKLEETSAVINCKKLPQLAADQNQMIQLFQNLIENSIKFSSKSPEIIVSSIETDREIILSVKDNGIGIESQYSDRIFKIFQRLHPKGEYGGMGVGLAICQRIVERHGGKIWFESEPGKGCTFSFRIPVRELK